MKTLRLSNFGIRGFVGESLTPNVVVDVASAFGTYAAGGRVLVARDTRSSSGMLHAAVLSGLLATGCEVVDLGVCPAPILQFSVAPFGAAGAISISGGHNPMGWNAVTLIDSGGAVLSPLGGEAVLDVFHAGDFAKKEWNAMGSVREAENFAGPYLDALERQVAASAIRKARFTVLIDPVGGAACAFLQPFADRFGLNLVPINAQPSGYLAREAEPRPRSATQMASIIRPLKGHVGFLLSSDAGRVSLVTEDGEPVSEEYTLPVVTAHVLERNRGVVVTNCCTTRTVDDVAGARGGRVVKTPVGQAYVVAALMDEQGVIGGEGSGGVVFPSFSRAFDGFLVMALVLEAMAEHGRTSSQLIKALPRYHIVKRRVPCESRRAYAALERIKDRLASPADARIDLTDGVRVDGEDGWVHVRASQTEQLIRVISEAATRDRAERRADELIRMIEQEV